MNYYLLAVVAFLAGAWLLHAVSNVLSARRAAAGVPTELADVFDAATYARAQVYNRAVMRYSVAAETASTVLALAVILSGGFNWLDLWVRSWGMSPLWTGLAYIGVVALAGSLAGLPFEIYRTFVLEARFGFNTTTPATFVADRIKGTILAAVLGGVVLAGVLLFFERAGSAAWLWCWGLVTLFSLALTYVAPTWILPLFNTFTPLEDGPLRRAIGEYARRMDFELDGIFVMDGSRRSSKSNAFFTGLGRRKRIALFDTLLADHTGPEILAVLAHETGHARLGHIRKRLVSGVARSGLLFFLMSLFLDSSGLFAAFGMEHQSVYAGLVFFLLLYTPVSMLIGVLANRVSRTHEFEADAFAARTTGDAGAMIAALKRLAAANLSNLTPHPLTVWLEYGHPPVLARIRALAKSQ